MKYIHGTESTEQERLAALNRLTNEPFIEFLGLTETSSVLEVGSGLGILTRDVAQRTPGGKVWGVEYSAEQLARAPSDVPNLRFVQGDAHSLPFEDNRFDVVYCRYVLEHVENPGKVLEEMRRVLNPGGRAYAQENNILVNIHYPECPAFEEVWMKFGHLQTNLGGDPFIGKKLFSLFRAARFADVELSIQPEIHYAGLPSFRPWIQNLIGNIQSSSEDLQNHQLATRAQIEEAVRELQQFSARDDASAIFYWNRARGVKK